MNKTNCVVKIWNYDGNLAQLVRDISSDYKPIPIGRDDVHKQMLFYPTEEGNYIIILSQAEVQDPRVEHNVMVSVMGPMLERAQSLMSSLEKELGFPLRDSPGHLKLFQSMLRLAR